jgi:glucose-6-phosphate isomerase
MVPMPDSKSSPLRFSLDLALSGKGAPLPYAWTASLAKADGALVWLREQAAGKSLELLGVPARTDDLRAAQKAAAAIKGMKTIAVLGIGGSSLGGQALTALKKKPGVEFHDNPDPFSWDAALKRFDLKKTHFIAISKSGGTAETLMQVLTAAEALKKAGVKSLKKHFTVITEPKKSVLGDLADGIGAQRLDHPTGIGGRYSVLTMVGALPAILMGIDVKALRAGAGAVLAETLAAKSANDAPAAEGAALHHALAGENKLATTIL